MLVKHEAVLLIDTGMILSETRGLRSKASNSSRTKCYTGCYPGKQSRISNDIISHYSSSNAVSSRHLSEDTQSIPMNIGSFKGKYSGLAVNSTNDIAGQVR